MIPADKEFPPAPVRGDMTQQRARMRQMMFLCQVVAGCSLLMREAGAAGIAAPGISDIRGWAAWAIEEIVTDCEVAQGLRPGLLDDPVKDALSDSIAAAIKGDPEAYAQARVREAEARRQCAMA